MKIEDRLETEANRLFEVLSKLDPKTDEYKLVHNELFQLTGRDIEYRKLALDTTEKTRANELANRRANFEVTDKTEGRMIEREKLKYEERRLAAETRENRAVREQDAKVKKVQMRDERINNIVRNGISIITFVAGTTVSYVVTKAVFKFQETGEFVDPFGKKILTSFLPEWKMFKC
jgi:hypothetical protein